MKKERNINLDLIRVIAVISLISVHFFLNSEFYSVNIVGTKLIIMTYMRTFFMICVPLFLLLTGYLMGNKKISKNYYLGIFKILFIYIIAAVLCILYKIILLNQSFNIFDFVRSILDFSGATYSWYINMYIGLFLLIPFLNIMYKNIGKKSHKKLLIITFLCLTMLPTFLNIKYQLIPNWWTGIYPITYYFIGNYIKEYGIKIKTSTNIMLLVSLTLLFGTINLYFSYETKFVLGIFNDWYGFMSTTISVLVFILILNLKLDRIPKTIKKLITKISELSLGIYLISFVFDDAFYSVLNSNVANVSDRLYWFPVMVLSVTICSFIVSMLIDLFKKIIILLINKAVKNRRIYE